MLHLSHCVNLKLYITAMSIFILIGCATYSANHFIKPFDASKYKSIYIESCVDRTGSTNSRNIANEATQDLREKILALDLFEIRPDGDLMLSCDVESFAEGNAFKRWIWPGWGTTKAKITVMIWEQSSQTVLTELSSLATVEAGGLYTIGADKYIIDVAINNIIKQLKSFK